MQTKNFYTYGITNKITGKKYIGSRESFKKPSEDLGEYYFSSSSDKEFISNQKNNPDAFLYEILLEGETRTEVIDYEIELHSRYDVKNNSDFYNLANQTSSKFILNSDQASKASADNWVEVKKDPVRMKEISERHRKVATKTHKEIKANPKRHEKNKLKKSKSAKEAFARTRDNPEKMESFRDKQRINAFKREKEMRNNPEKYKARQTKLSEKTKGIRNPSSKPVLKLDKDTQEELEGWLCASYAAEDLGLNAVRIRVCAREGKGVHGNSQWKYPKLIKEEHERD